TYGDNLRALGDPAASVREQAKILEQDSANIYALIYMAQAYLSMGAPRQAKETLERVRPEDRKNYQIRLTRAVQLALEGNAEGARQELDGEALKYAEFPGFGVLPAQTYAILGQMDQALDWLDRAVRAGDERAEWFERELLLAKLR